MRSREARSVLGRVALAVGATTTVVSVAGLLRSAPHAVSRGTVPTAGTTTSSAAPTSPGLLEVLAGPASAAPSLPPVAAAGVTPIGFLPARVQVPALHIDADITPVTVTSGSLAVPADPAQVGWWAAGALAGTGSGTVVLDGHVDTRQQDGALFALSTVTPGTVINLNGPDRTASYRVTGVREYPKTGLPADAFKQGSASRLVLVTCGGPFDTATGHYRDNVVVYATPA